MRKRQPSVQFFPLASPNHSIVDAEDDGVASFSVRDGLNMEGPLYNVMIVAPPTQARVPTSFAIPSRRSNRTFSILLETSFGNYYGPRKQPSEENVKGCHLRAAAMAKVMAGTEFWMAEAKVGEVLSSPSR